MAQSPYENLVDGPRAAAVVCTHIRKDKLPILQCLRGDSDDAVDSGWQFHCGVLNHENTASGEIWALREVVDFEPTILEFVNDRPGTFADRKDGKSRWIVGWRADVQDM